MTAFELLNNEKLEAPKLWDPFISSTNLHGLIGPSDTGKSTFLRQLALAIVFKKDNFLGYPLHVQHGRVIYVSLEDDEHDVREFFKIHLQGENSELLKNLILIFDLAQLEERIIEELFTAPADLIIIDPWSALIHGSTNNLTDVRESTSRLRELSRQTNVPFVLIHHTVKKAERFQPDKNKVNGSQAIEAALRIVQELRNDTNDPNLKILSHLKGNRLKNSIKDESILLDFDENLLLFKFRKVIKRKELIIQLGKGKYDDDRDIFVKEGRELREQNYSYAQVKKALEDKYGSDKVPGETWLKANL